MRNGSPDNYQTPPEALIPLFPYLKKKWKIWECAWGEGNLFNELKRKGFEVIGTDINSGKDFLNSNCRCDCVITNPPYSLKDDFIEKCYEIGKPFALLLPLTALEGKRRQAQYKKHGVQLILFDKRINFKTPNRKGSGSWFATAWFTHGLNLPKELNFVELKQGGSIAG